MTRRWAAIHMAQPNLSARTAQRQVGKVKKFLAARKIFTISYSLHPPGFHHPTTTAARARWHAYRLLRWPLYVCTLTGLKGHGGHFLSGVTLERRRRWWSPFGRPLRAGSALHERGKTADGGVEKLRLWIKSSPRIRLTLSKSY